jgi:sulfoxide reductase catalytic subunit YedY
MKINPSEITPEHLYLSRRAFLKGLGLLSAGTLLLSSCDSEEATTPIHTATPSPPPRTTRTADEYGDPLNTFDDITTFNNFYEFTTDKSAVARASQDFITSPWTVQVDGLVRTPKTYDLDDLMKFQQEERVYRLRCVEGWSMVIPWIGFPLASLLREVEPTSDARYVRFVTLHDPDRMPGQKRSGFRWPYVEGLRLDEAMHDLTILATGLYGKSLLPQSGAPVRLVVPWKYGFKNIKSIVKIELVAEQPTTFWMIAAPQAYGFFSNVNPMPTNSVLTQANEVRFGDSSPRPTLLFNGYEDQVSGLYDGMDLGVNY